MVCIWWMRPIMGNLSDCYMLHKIVAWLTRIKSLFVYNFDPLKPLLLYSATGFYRGIHYFFLISAQNIDCGYSLEPPRRGGSNEYPQSMFLAEIWKILEFFFWKLSFFLVVKFSVYLNRLVLVMRNPDDFVLSVFRILCETYTTSETRYIRTRILRWLSVQI